MQILSARQNGQEVSPEQIQEDMPRIEKVHKFALFMDATWEFFGGVVTVEDREYQVM